MVPVMSRSYAKPSRALDWFCALAVLGVGLTMMQPDAFIYFGFQQLLNAGPREVWMGACIGVGTARLLALIINGRLYEGAPIVRTFGALLGAVMWAVLAVNFLDLSLALGMIAPSVVIPAFFAGGDIFNATRAARDAIHGSRARHDRI